ncbi:aminotransferase class I/II-fold pyridoxal phosphate-dependent enzyme [Anaerobiospirillum thomasii]|uniref:Pyridoxal phosphate-dependent acyltransferase n=1 Tax=Anaerobiospirillum thomasii TaxID=179995 RepID=A0A2X0VCG1_9GAMM|nr:aminotransferase class I/II-fold pyridoxal phosphate-dependent enzyme [Anaerobiospirillum thomasii]SPT70886.1 Putative pyridoxal phosphate-dependent acyltransferase [Anaerobiospirillum thomasii]
MHNTNNKDTQSLLSRFKARQVSGNAGGQVSLNREKVQKAQFKDFLLYKKIKAHSDIASEVGVQNPFMLCHSTIAKAHSVINGRDYLNFATYDYLGLNGDERINEAAYKTMQDFGTSAGASRLVAGERPCHELLEHSLASHYGQESAIVYVSGHATNVSAISTLFGKDDLIVYDRLSHNSIMLGAKFSGATCLAYKHNDMSSLEELLRTHRHNHKNTLIVTEGVFSMDGDVADLQSLVAIKQRFNAFLMVDEAHALGVVGKSGAGSFEHCGIDPVQVDIYMGTLSKTLCSCGGYIAGCKELIEILKYYSAGFVYSVGLSPVLAMASYTALDLMHKETFRVSALQDICAFAKDYALECGLDVGNAQGTAVLPIIIGSSLKATALSNLLFEHGVLALPIIYPAVEEEKARIRLFLSYSHSRDDIKHCLDLIKSLDAAAEKKVDTISAD